MRFILFALIIALYDKLSVNTKKCKDIRDSYGMAFVCSNTGMFIECSHIAHYMYTWQHHFGT